MKELTEEHLIDWWLNKYHNTSLKKIREEHPEWGDHNPEYTSHIFYDAYPVTQEQHDEWCEWAKKEVKKYFKLSKIGLNKSFGFIYLNTSPKVMKLKI
jgi:hypothetical protein